MVYKLLAVIFSLILIGSAAALWVAYLIQLVKREEEILEEIQEQRHRREEKRRQKEDKKKSKADENEDYYSQASELVASEKKGDK